MLLPVPSLQLIPLATSLHPYEEMLPHITVQLSGSCCLRPHPPPPIFHHLPTSATEHRTHAELEAHPPTRMPTGGLLYSQPSPAQPSPGIPSSYLTCGQSRAGNCLLRLRAGVADKGAAVTPQAQRAALGTQGSASSASLQLPAWRYASSGGVTPRRIPGLPAVTVRSEIGGPEKLGSEMGLQTPAEFVHFPKAQASVCDSSQQELRAQLELSTTAPASQGYWSPDGTLPGELRPKLGSLWLIKVSSHDL